jgi:hypothetical protein
LPLEVGQISFTLSTNYGYINSGAATGTGSNTGSNAFSARFDGRIIVGQEVEITSDYRSKNSITDLNNSFCDKFIKTVNPVTYKFNNELEDGKSHYGFIAQDLIKQGFEQLVSIIPETGMEEIIEEDGFVNPKDHKFVLCYDEIIPILTKNIQMLLKRVEQLEAKLEANLQS